jgi:hypothetical protein
MKKTEKSLLNTKIKDLTPEIVAQLEKPLGTFDRPFPMWGTQRVDQGGGVVELKQVLSPIKNNDEPMRVYSERPYKEVMALAYCDMPVPSMLPILKKGLERRAPESANKTQFVIGDPGHGKSFLGAMQGKLRSTQSVEIFDCGDKNMNELLFEMVLDFGAGDALPMAIDKRLKAGTLQPLSMGLIGQLNGLGGATEVIVTTDDKGRTIVDWELLRTGSAEKIESAYQILTKISKVEALDGAAGNALGMNSQYGPLIRWYIEGREGVLDEYNKMRKGTDNGLQTVWQFMIGEIPNCTVENPLKNKDSAAGPSSFTFRRDDMKAGFFLTLTGNKTEDGVTTHSLNKSAYDRLAPTTLPDPDMRDWQHRICQLMTGMPVSTLYAVFKESADTDPDGFGEWLVDMRQEKARMEGVPLSAFQETLLVNWQKTVRATEGLANVLDKWATLTGQNIPPELFEEVDEEYSKKEGMSFRKVKHLLEEAIAIHPKMQSADAPVHVKFGDWFKQPVLAEKVVENPSLNFGTRLVDALDEMIHDKTTALGKTILGEKLNVAMREFGMRDIDLKDAERSKVQSVEDSLNMSAFSDRDLGKQAVMARKTFCEYLRQVDPEIQGEDEDIITVKKIRDALEHIKKQSAEETKSLFFVNRDHATLSASPVEGAVIEDNALYEIEDKEMSVSIQNLVHHDDFMAALALPVVGKQNLSAIWDKNIRALNEVREQAGENDNTSSVGAIDDALLVAENASPYGVATTTLCVRYNDGAGEDDHDVSVHIVHNADRDKTLIVGESAPSKLFSAFKEAGITFVNRNDPSAKEKVEAALKEMTRNMPDDVNVRLIDAFKYRNDVPIEEDAGRKASFSELLVDKSIDIFQGKYLTKSNKPSV